MNVALRNNRLPQSPCTAYPAERQQGMLFKVLVLVQLKIAQRTCGLQARHTLAYVGGKYCPSHVVT